jgi:O-acetyl-ADP-ribose deacetylase (regulator of RNase III)
MAEKKVGDKVIRLVLGDITDLEVEAFVFDITEDAKLGSGYGNAIAMRGGLSVQKALDEIGSVPTGTGVITDAGKMKAKKIIHVNGPKFHEPETEKKLKSATLAALKLADENGLTQLAFPPVGTGFYQVPLDLCANVMVNTVEEHLKGDTKLQEVLFVALDTREYKPLKAKIGQGA